MAREEWQPPRSWSLLRFRRDGKLAGSEYHNPDGSVTRAESWFDDAGRLVETRVGAAKTCCSYDGAGRLSRVTSIDESGAEHELETYRYSQDGQSTKTYSVPKMELGCGFSYQVTGGEVSYGATDAARIDTIFDANGGTRHAIFYDAADRVLRRVIFHRDSAGRLRKEEMLIGETTPIPDLPPELFEAAFGGITSEYDYDDAGRISERRQRFGALGGSRTIRRYDRHGNKLEETAEDSSRELRLDDQSRLQSANERSSRRHTRFEYVYDEYGNWTERVVWGRLEPNPDFQRSNIERRAITYYQGWKGSQ